MRLGKAIVPVLTYALVALVLAVGMAIVRPVRVAGGSMSPALRAGDIALVSKAEPRLHDIVLVQQPGRGQVLHRVVDMRAGDMVTRGDANPTNDRIPARKAWVRGTVRAVIPLGVVFAKVADWRGLR